MSQSKLSRTSERRKGEHSKSGFCQHCWDKAYLLLHSSQRGTQADHYNKLIKGECSEDQNTVQL